MTPEAIEAIQNALPSAIRLADPSPEWPDEVLPVSEGDPLWIEIEEELDAPGDPDDPDPLADTPDSELPPDKVIEVTGRILSGHLDADDPYGPVTEISGKLQDRFGDGWPGAPGGTGIAPGPAAGVPVMPRRPQNPDTCAFYLPWHRFRPNLWGIYLLVEGIQAVGKDIHALVPCYLSRSEARRSARLFLYHHEAYHNAVETFAARIEVSHRSPCYLTGVHACANSFLATSALHEEGLANAYAHDKVRRYLLANASMSNARRRLKRVAAGVALRHLFQMQAAAYASAERILSGAVGFDDAECELQETCHALSSLHVPPMAPGIWIGAPRAMAPSLSRNKSYSYIVSRSHPAIRQAVHVPHFDRRDVVRRLRLATGATNQAVK